MSKRTNWRSMKTAPKDEHILLKYEGADQRLFVHAGRWVDVPYLCQVERVMRGEIAKPERMEGHWLISYGAILQHSGAYEGLSFESRSMLVFPKQWQPLPTP